jgi:hypothetical protein
MVTKKKKKKKSSRILKKKAWDLLSKIIRLKNADDNGYCACVTCGIVKHWTEMQAGHFIPKAQGNSVYFLEENIHVQCVSCNIFLAGNLTNYTLYMIDMYGRDEVERLKAVRNEKIKISSNDYEEMILEFKNRLVELL